MNLSRLLLAAALAASTCAVALPAHAASADQKDKGKDEGKPTVVATVVPGATPADVAATTNGDANGKDKAAKDKPVKDGAVGGTDATTPAVDAPGAPADRPAALAPAAPPVAGKSVAATVTEGTVRVRLPGADTYLPLSDAASMPVGTVVDARRGEVVMQVALPGKPAETASFSGSMFQLHQGKGATTIRLRGGDFGKCLPQTHTFAMVSRTRPKAPVVRSLWASDHGGHFRTHGHNSVATVRGTTWLTEDRCDGTLTRVTGGAVEVYDRHTHRKVLVRAGHSYLARHP